MFSRFSSIPPDERKLNSLGQLEKDLYDCPFCGGRPIFGLGDAGPKLRCSGHCRVFMFLDDLPHGKGIGPDFTFWQNQRNPTKFGEPICRMEGGHIERIVTKPAFQAAIEQTEQSEDGLDRHANVT
jgi:hypothetical protein